MSAPKITEIVAGSVSTHGPNCVGCQRHKRDVLLVFGDTDQMVDVLLTWEQAAEVIGALQRRLAEVGRG